MVAKTEFDELDKRKSEIENRDKARNMNIFRAMSLFFTMQFGVSYYSIFHVEWLGWDLVEPLTYTAGQGSFMLGLIYILRNRGVSVEYGGLEEHF